MAPDASASCEKMLRHHNEVLCGNDAHCIAYSLGWWSSLLQNPQSKIGVSVCYRWECGQLGWCTAHGVHGGVGGPSSGRQGVGKGIFISSVVDMLAPYSSSLSSHKQLLGNFNAILANKCLVFLDEVGWRQTLLC